MRLLTNMSYVVKEIHHTELNFRSNHRDRFYWLQSKLKGLSRNEERRTEALNYTYFNY